MGGVRALGSKGEQKRREGREAVRCKPQHKRCVTAVVQRRQRIRQLVVYVRNAGPRNACPRLQARR